MLKLRIFLRNHSVLCAWADLPAPVQRLFTGAGEAIAWSEFYMADTSTKRRQFEFLVRSDAGAVVPHRADIVMLQDAFEMMTFVQFPEKRAGEATCVCLQSVAVERAVLRSR